MSIIGIISNNPSTILSSIDSNIRSGSVMSLGYVTSSLYYCVLVLGGGGGGGVYFYPCQCSIRTKYGNMIIRKISCRLKDYTGITSPILRTKSVLSVES